MSNAALAIAAILGILAGIVPVVVGVVLHHFQVVNHRHVAPAVPATPSHEDEDALVDQAVTA